MRVAGPSGCKYALDTRVDWMAARRGGLALLLQGPRLRSRFLFHKPKTPDVSPGGEAAERMRTTLRAFLAGQEAAMEVSRDERY